MSRPSDPLTQKANASRTPAGTAWQALAPHQKWNGSFLRRERTVTRKEPSVSMSPTVQPPAARKRQPVRQWYKNLPLMAGLVLIALGLGNWITGSIRTAEHAQQIEESLQAPSRGGVSSKRPSAEEVEIARVRMDFYHVVASGGRLMTAAGFLLTTFGLARSLRPRARKG